MGTTGRGRSRRQLWLAALPAAVLALELRPALAAGAIALLGLLWLAAQPRRADGRWLGAAILWLPAVVLTAVLVYDAASRAGDRPARLEAAWVALCDDLDEAADIAAAAVGPVPIGREDRLAAFEQLQGLAARPGFRGKSLLLFDPDGEAVAWAGEGLLHEPSFDRLRAGEMAFERSYSAATLLAVRALGDGTRPWRLVVGRSDATDRLPFAVAGDPTRRWSLGVGAPKPGVLRLERPGAPSMYVVEAGAEHGAETSTEGGGGPAVEAARRVARGLLALGCLALAVLGGLGGLLAASASGPAPAARGVAVLAFAGILAAARSAELPWPPALAAALAAVTAASLLGPSGRSSHRTAVLLAVTGTALLGAAAWAYQRIFGLVDLGSELAATPLGWALRSATILAALAVLGTAARSAAQGTAGRELPRSRLSWLAAATLLAAGAFHDLPWLAAGLLAAAAGVTALWLTGFASRRRVSAFATLLLLAALTGAGAWEAAYRLELRRQLETHYLPRVAPPTRAELDELYAELYEVFHERDLGDLRPPGGGPVESQDLAYALWRRSPLPARDGLSALVVEPFAGEASSFSLGLTLDDQLQLLWDPGSWNVPATRAWRDSLLLDEMTLLLAGEPWATVRYWFLPRPGFRLAFSEIEELEEALLRGRPSRRFVDGLPAGVLYALYSDTGEVLASPWEEEPPLGSTLLEGEGTVRAPAGLCWFWSREGRDGLEVLFLPRLGALEGLERVATHALSALLLLAGMAAAVLLLALPRPLFVDWLRSTIRSYSKRLILVYTVLLFVPLLALSLVLLRGFEERLRQEQSAHGREALESARRFLNDFLLGLRPGFDVATEIDRELLDWISSIVHHQVNLYWRSRLYASSQQELFTAGLLPRRIPGEIFSRLVLLGYELGPRSQRSGERVYVELYAPLQIPGVPASEERFFVSVPLLEQEKEVVQELAALRRQTLLVTSGLFLLLMAVGSQLARSFTKPLMELVEGTRRIAAGAPSLELAPRELELAALGAAIDDMAGRIADARERLLREKQVVETVVENITSGVISVDRERRVRWLNRVAAELLGARVGEPLGAQLEAEERLAQVASFLDQAGDGLSQTTLRLVDDDGAEAEWTLIWVPIPGSDDPAALLLVDDATEVLRAQRLEAWAEMARIIAHEIKNPLTPIRLSAEHMREVWASRRERFEEVFERCTTNILRQVEELRDIASEFSIYSRIPRAELSAGDLGEALGELVEGYRHAPSRGVEISWHPPAEPVIARFDRRLLGRAVRNLLENALRASGEGGRVEVELAASDVTAEGAATEGAPIRGVAADGRLTIRVADSGPGVRPEHLSRIFEPYFSTHDTGTGLGLPITRRVVEEHGGEIVAHNRPGGGLEVVITMPHTKEA